MTKNKFISREEVYKRYHGREMWEDHKTATSSNFDKFVNQEWSRDQLNDYARTTVLTLLKEALTNYDIGTHIIDKTPLPFWLKLKSKP